MIGVWKISRPCNRRIREEFATHAWHLEFSIILPAISETENVFLLSVTGEPYLLVGH